MPQFKMDTFGEITPPGAPPVTYQALSAFVQGYIEAMFFTDSSPAFTMSKIEANPADWQEAEREGTSDGQFPGDACFDDLDGESLARIIAECAAFEAEAAHLLAAAYDRPGYEEVQAGRDFWFTRNGHGVGFWDRKELDADGLGDRLSDVARYSEVNTFWQDGKVYHD